MTDHLHFVTLLGSLRRGSFNRCVAHTLDELAPDDVQVTMLGSVAELPLYSQDIQDVGIPDAVTALAAAIAAADGVVIVTPEYNFSVPGGLKNALDWLSRVSPQPFAGKAVAFQTASPGPFGGIRAQYHLRQTLVSLEAEVINKPELMISHVAAKIDAETGILRDQETRTLVARQLEVLAAMVRARQA